jgi:hypothetical protein
VKKYNSLYIIHSIEIDKIVNLDFPFLPYRKERICMTATESHQMNSICYDLLYLDCCQALYNCGYKKSLEFHFEQKDFDKKMLCDSIGIMALNLNLIHFSRLQFLSNLMSKRTNFLMQNISTEIYPRIDKHVGMILLNKYNEFLEKWCFSPIFLMLFTLPYNEKLKLSTNLFSHWIIFKKDIKSLLDFFNTYVDAQLMIKVFSFWLNRIHEANLWNDKDNVLKTFCKRAFFSDDIETNRVYSYADYFGTIMGGQFIREYGRFLYFPVYSENKIKNYDRNKVVEFLDRQVYDRLSSCLAVAGEGQKGKLLVDAVTQPSKVSNDEALEILRFLKYYSSVHFMGHIGELFGLSMAQMASKSIFNSDIVCIPGSSIFINTDKGVKQGPDGIFGKIIQKQDKLHLIIEGLIEIKSYRVSYKKLQAQLKQHLQRLIDNEILLTASSFDSSGQWFSKETIGDDIKIKTFKINQVHISNKLQYIAIVPSYKKRRQCLFMAENYHLLEMPWSPKGFRSMALYFIVWVVENYGRIGDESNYQKGKDSLKILLDRLKKVRMLKKSDVYMVKGLSDALENLKVGNPDKYWFQV